MKRRCPACGDTYDTRATWIREGQPTCYRCKNQPTKEHTEVAKNTATPKTATRTKGRADIRYFHDGMSLSEGHKAKLSTLAYFYSFDISASSPDRLGTKDFAAILAKAGVADPGAPGWMVKLPNGVTVECRVDGEKSQFTGTAVTRAKKATATKATATKATATKPAAAVKKSTGPKSPAGRNRADARASKATKKAPAKKATAAKSTAKKAAAKRPTRAN